MYFKAEAPSDVVQSNRVQDQKGKLQSGGSSEAGCVWGGLRRAMGLRSEEGRKVAELCAKKSSLHRGCEPGWCGCTTRGLVVGEEVRGRWREWGKEKERRGRGRQTDWLWWVGDKVEPVVWDQISEWCVKFYAEKFTLNIVENGVSKGFRTMEQCD